MFPVYPTVQWSTPALIVHVYTAYLVLRGEVIFSAVSTKSPPAGAAAPGQGQQYKVNLTPQIRNRPKCICDYRWGRDILMMVKRTVKHIARVFMGSAVHTLGSVTNIETGCLSSVLASPLAHCTVLFSLGSTVLRLGSMTSIRTVWVIQ